MALQHQFIRAAEWPLPEPFDPAAATAALAALAAARFTAVAVCLPWQTAHPRAGEFDWFAADSLLFAAQERDLGVILAPGCDVIPGWLSARYPEALHSEDCTAGGATPLCLNHPEAHAHRQEFLAGLVRRYAGHPALLMWNPAPFAAAHVCCRCEYCRRGFLTWLQDHYPSFGALNRAWSTSFRTWDELVAFTPDEQQVPEVARRDWADYHRLLVNAEIEHRFEITEQLDHQHPLLYETSADSREPEVLPPAAHVIGLRLPLEITPDNLNLPRTDGRLVLAYGLRPAGPRPRHIRQLDSELLRLVGRGIKGFVLEEVPLAPLPLGQLAQLNGLFDVPGDVLRRAQPMGLIPNPNGLELYLLRDIEGSRPAQIVVAHNSSAVPRNLECPLDGVGPDWWWFLPREDRRLGNGRAPWSFELASGASELFILHH